MGKSKKLKVRCLYCERVMEDNDGKPHVLCMIYGWREYPNECNKNCPHYEEL